MQRLAAVNGLVALVGSETYLIQVRKHCYSKCHISKSRLFYISRFSKYSM